MTDAQQMPVDRIVDMVHAMVKDVERTAQSVAQAQALTELETQVERWVRQIGRAALQAGWGEYEKRPEPRKFSCACGRGQASHKGTREASVTSVFGLVKLKRRAYECRRCQVNFSPGMEQLGLNGHTYTPRVQEVMALLELSLPQRHAAHALTRMLGVRASPGTVADVSVRWGRWLGEQRGRGPGQSPHGFSGSPLYAGVDGTMVHSRAGGWRELKIGTLYNDDKTDTGYYASFACSEEFKSQWQEYAHWTGALDAAPIRVTGDGAGWVWTAHDWVFPHAHVRFLDFWHAAEHLWEYARAAYGDGTSRCRRWAESMMHRLKHQGPASVLPCVKRHRPKTPEAQEQRRQLQGYIERHAELMDYPGLRAQGIDIGDGPVESGCKIIGSRLKGGQKRWQLDRAQAIATLRCTFLSDEWHHLPKPRMANRTPKQRQRLQPLIQNYNQAFLMN
ncbi:MAG: ISKra4 family transposase [Proteobacteria bacterium]|nr:ISKra4 family transposase [Pseudomonadota bacterium]